MTEDDLKAVLAKYQQKSFELFNQNIVLETQVEQLNKTVASLQEQVQKLTAKPKRGTKEEEFS
jgi:dynactin complex subunit